MRLTCPCGFDDRPCRPQFVWIGADAIEEWLFVTAWLDNTPAVADPRCLQVTEADLPALCDPVQNPVHGRCDFEGSKHPPMIANLREGSRELFTPAKVRELQRKFSQI